MKSKEKAKKKLWNKFIKSKSKTYIDDADIVSTLNNNRNKNNNKQTINIINICNNNNKNNNDNNNNNNNVALIEIMLSNKLYIYILIYVKNIWDSVF